VSHTTPCTPAPLPPVDSLSGPALAEAVAVEVMGWHHALVAFGSGRSPRMSWMGADGGYECLEKEWAPDCDIANAWQVIQHVREVTGEWILFAPWKQRFIAWLQTGCGDPDYGLHAYGDTAPEAISRAALKALRAQNGGAR